MATLRRADVQREKPDPEGYLLAARMLGVAPECCIVVEDSLIVSKAGVAAGMRKFYLPQQPSVRHLVPEGAHHLARAANLSHILRSAVRQLLPFGPENMSGQGR